MKARMTIAPCLMAAALLACSAAGDGRSPERVGARDDAWSLTFVHLLPLPKNIATGSSAWNGTRADLMVADAWAECSTSDGVNFADWGDSTDGYLDYVQNDILLTSCSATPTDAPTSTLGRWFAMRRTKACAFSSSEDVSGDAVPLEPLGVRPLLGSATFGSDNTLAVSRADMALRRATANLCIAERLRVNAPGASTGESLLMSSDDQRELVEVIRERAQQSMLQFAALSMIAAQPTPFTPPASDLIADRKYLSVLSKWAATESSTVLEEMGEGFARAVKLHAEVTREMASLLARSGDARLPRGGTATTSVDEYWGAGSWRDRALASLYGGDPLAVGRFESKAPWADTHGDFIQFPGRKTPNGMDTDAYRDWADATMNPYPRTALADPQVLELQRLALLANAVNIKVAADGTLDADGSAMRIYLATEAWLRNRNCSVVLADGTCKAVALSDVPVPSSSDPSAGYRTYELWARHRITPAHAQTLARTVAEALGQGAPSGRAAVGTRNIDAIGSVWTLPDPNGGSAAFWHVPSSASFHAKKIQQIAPLYTRFGRRPTPRSVDVSLTAAYQGFGDRREEREGSRLMGSIPALMAVRADLDRTFGVHPEASGLLRRRREIVELVDAVAGKSGVSIQAGTQQVRSIPTLPPFVAEWAQSASTDGTMLSWQVGVSADPADAWWDPDASYQMFAVHNVPAAASLVLYPGSRDFAEGWSVDCALMPAPAAGVAPLPCTSLITPSATVWKDLYNAQDSTDPTRPRSWTFSMSIPRSKLDDKWTFFVRKLGARPSYALLAASVSLDNVFEPRGYPSVPGYTSNLAFEAPQDGQFIGYGGTLGTLAMNLLARDDLDPTRPAYDAFGVPTRWSPPSSPELFAGTAGEDAVHHYLVRANDAALQATNQVKETFTALLEQATDRAQLAAAQAKASELAKIESRALCGDKAAATCDPVLTSVPIDVARVWDDYVFSPGAPLHHRLYAAASSFCADPTNVVPLRPTGADISSHLDCLALSFFRQIPRLRIFPDVAAHLADPVVPSFSGYEGGTLQRVMIAQWRAVRDLQNSMRDVLSSIDAAMARASAFTQVVERDQQRWDALSAQRCSPAAMTTSLIESACGLNQRTSTLSTQPNGAESPMEAAEMAALVSQLGGGPLSNSARCRTIVEKVVKGESVAGTDSDLTWGDEQGDPSQSSGTSLGGGFSLGLIGFNASGNEGMSSAGTVPVAQRRRMCEEAEAKLEGDQASAVSAAMESFAALTARLTSFVNTIGSAVDAGADGAALVQASRLTKARVQLDAVQLGASQSTSVHLWQQVNSYDVWRAQALLLDARIAAVTARRAIEARFAVDLSALTAPEPFVANPSTWADDIYQYDLDMPHSVGLAVGVSSADGIYPNRVVDYVANLTRFVDGFSVARPSAVASADTEILFLPGPLGLRDSSSAPLDAAHVDGLAAAWQYECATPAGTQWRQLPPSGKPNEACLPDAALPLRARTSFALDPWGRVNGDVASEPYTRRYNARWGKLAVNLVGTGVIDCAGAPDPSGCYAQSFVRYELDHDGPTWVSDWSQSWTVIGVPSGRIEGAKALASEQWLDPLSNSWGKPYVDAIARTELNDSPFGGTYDLILNVGPEVRLDRIQRVQLLVNASYWVKQQ